MKYALYNQLEKSVVQIESLLLPDSAKYCLFRQHKFKRLCRIQFISYKFLRWNSIINSGMIYFCWPSGKAFDNNSSAECKKVVSDIFGKIEFLMEYENIGFPFCTIFKVLSPFIFQNIKQNVFKNCHLRPYCTNIWQMCLMQEGRKCHLRPYCTNFRQMCVMQERHKCHLRPSCIKQLISLNSPCFGFTPTVHTKNSFKWNIKTNYNHILGTILNITNYPVFYNGK